VSLEDLKYHNQRTSYSVLKQQMSAAADNAA